MAKIQNLKAFTVSDGNQDYVNVDTVNGNVQIKNGTTITFYSDDGVTAGVKLTNTGTAPIVSATSPAIAGAGTIATSGVGIARVTPTAARTGIIMAAGTVAGQACWVVNEATSAVNSIQMDVSGTSNVASGTSCIIFGNQARHFSWDASTSLWVCSDPLVVGTTAPIISATSPDPGAAGTIVSAGVGIALVTPASNRTGIIIGVGTVPGQELWVVNQAASATLTLNTTPATANVADSATEAAIAGLTGRKYVWVGGSTNLWYPAK